MSYHFLQRIRYRYQDISPSPMTYDESWGMEPLVSEEWIPLRYFFMLAPCMELESHPRTNFRTM